MILFLQELSISMGLHALYYNSYTQNDTQISKKAFSISNDIENAFSDSTFIQNPLHLSTSSGTLFPVHYLL